MNIQRNNRAPTREGSFARADIEHIAKAEAYGLALMAFRAGVAVGQPGLHQPMDSLGEAMQRAQL
ncbi:MAG: hypothetical protein AAB971_00735 [Patescibacteria group bacterium]